MPLPEDLHFGKVYTHLSALLEQLEQLLSSRRRNVPTYLEQLNADPAYRQLAARTFRSPVADCEKSKRLLDRTARIKERAKASGSRDLDPFLESIDWFLGSHVSAWDEHDYFTVPVIFSGGSTTEAGFVYLHARPKMNIRGSSRLLEIHDLTSDPELLSYTRDYFALIASVFKKTFFFVRALPFDSEEDLNRHSYRLYFGSQIDEGESMGAAVLAAFGVAFLHSRLGARYASVINPQRGTIISGRIDHDGRVRGVDGVDKKVAAAVDEFGPGLKVILPEESHLPDVVARRLHEGNVTYVSRAEELLAAALSSGTDARGLDAARRAVFEQLTEPMKDTLRRLLEEGIEPDVYERIALGQNDWITPRSREGGVYVVTKSWQSQIDMRLGLEPSALEEGSGTDFHRELVQVILDGSVAMDGHWATDSRSEICRLTTVLFEIARRLDPLRQELVCGFLSHSSFRKIRHGTTAKELEDLIQGIRDTHGLRFRGPFFRPVYEASLREFSHYQKRVFILSDSFLPDCSDNPDLKLSSLVVLSLSQNTYQSRPSLFTATLALNLDLVRTYFSKDQGTIRSLSLDVGSELPLEWEPAHGRLVRDHDGFVLEWPKLDCLRIRLRIRMAHQAPSVIICRVSVDHEEGPLTVSFRESPRVGKLKPFGAGKQGCLVDSELRLWRSICSPHEACECGETAVHLLHPGEFELAPKPVFPSLASLGPGWLLLREDQPEWHHFQNGCGIDELGMITIQGELYWSEARGHLEPLFHDGQGVYKAETRSGQKLYGCRLLSTSAGR